MYKKLDETISDTFVKPEKGLYTELFVIENLGLGKKAGNYLKEKYSPKERFKMMRKEYNLAQNNIVKPLALEELNGQKTYVLEKIDGDMLMNSLYKIKGNTKLFYSIKQQLEDTVEILHRNGYVHGDLVSGNNIMLTKEGKIKLIDSLYIPKDFEYKNIFIDLDNEAINSVINLMYGKVGKFIR
ncbi:protein kinase [Candidatus Parvarchaeota archaeon]|jgi:serine/threonine protein kinase|nr:protein kinase [Candidatus Parvarchaeota archaeon]